MLKQGEQFLYELIKELKLMSNYYVKPFCA